MNHGSTFQGRFGITQKHHDRARSAALTHGADSAGDRSRGTAGLWIENGTPAFPIEATTIAGNMKELLTRIEAVGNDLLVLGEVFSPAQLIGGIIINVT